MRRVVITGLGVVSPLGVGTKISWTNLINSKSGLVSTALAASRHENTISSRKKEDETTKIQLLKDNYSSLPCQVVGMVPSGNKIDGGWNGSEYLNDGDRKRVPRFVQYALAATKEALEDSEWFPESEHDRLRTGVSIGSGIGSIEDAYDNAVGFHTGGYRKVQPLFIPRLLSNMGAGHVSIHYKLHGPNHSTSTACTTGNHSIGDASRFIMMGDADVMVAGSTESTIHPIAIAGFSRAKSLATHFNDTPEKASRPFDRDRCGFVMGEGSGIMVLEELEHALARKAKIYAEVMGYGLSADGVHITAPPPDGYGAYNSMKMALNHGNIKPSEVDYINAHATSTHLGDKAESTAITRLLLEGPHGKPSASDINVSSSKGAIGHLLGGSGSVESIFTVLSIVNNIMPPTLNLDNLEEGFECNYIPNFSQERKVETALTNSFGFGGTNASLCFRKFRG